MLGPHPEGAALLITASPAPGKYEVQVGQRRVFIGHGVYHRLWVRWKKSWAFGRSPWYLSVDCCRLHAHTWPGLVKNCVFFLFWWRRGVLFFFPVYYYFYYQREIRRWYMDAEWIIDNELCLFFLRPSRRRHSHALQAQVMHTLTLGEHESVICKLSKIITWATGHTVCQDIPLHDTNHLSAGLFCMRCISAVRSYFARFLLFALHDRTVINFGNLSRRIRHSVSV